MQDNITKLIILSILGGISSSTLRRLIENDGLIEPEIIGRRMYFHTKSVYRWLSELAGRDVAIGDKLLSSKQLESLFSRSSGWIWIKFRKKKLRKAKAIELRSRLYYLESDVYSDPELSKYLEVAKGRVEA